MADNRKFLDYTGLVKLIEGLRGKFVEQDKLVANYLTKANLKAANVAYKNTEHMDGVETVKDALDVLAANVVRQEDKLAEDGKAMQAVETKVDNLQAQVGVEAKDGKPATGLVSRIGVLEELMGKDEEGTSDSFAKRVADLESEVDDLQVALADGGDIEKRIQANEDAIEEINNAENGILAQAKDYADGLAGNYDAAGAAAQALVDAKTYADGKDTAMDARVDALEAFKDGHDHKPMEDNIDALQEAVNTLKGAVDVEGSVAKAIADHVAEQLEKDNAQDKLIAKKADQTALEEYANDFEFRIRTNEAFVSAQPAIDAEQDRRLGVIEAAIGEDGALEARVAANEDAIEVINGTGEGSIKKAVADLVDSAPEAMNTLNELAKAIGDNKDVYDAYVKEHATAMATMKSDLQDEIDADVKVEADRAKAEEADIRADFAAADAQVLADAKQDAADKVAAEVTRVDKKIGEDIAAAIAQEVTDRDAAILVETNRAKGIEEGLQDAIDALEAANAEGGAVAKAIDAVDGKADAAQAAADAAQDDVDALAEVVGKKAEGEAAATGVFADIAVVQAEVDAAEGRIDALEGKAHEHANKEELDKFKDGDKAALDKAVDDIATINDAKSGILAQAKAYTDQIIALPNDDIAAAIEEAFPKLA